MGGWLKALWVRESVLSNSLMGLSHCREGKLLRRPGDLSILSSGSCAATAIGDSSVLQLAGLGAWMDGADSLRNPTCTSVLILHVG